MIGVVQICHALAGCYILVLTELPTEGSDPNKPAARLFFDTQEECEAVWIERRDNFAFLLQMQFGPAPVNQALACVTESVANREWGIPFANGEPT